MTFRAITAAMTLVLAGAAHAAPTYNIIDLGAGSAQDINAYGQVVGSLGSNAFLWTPTTANGGAGNVTVLGSGYGAAINSMGQVVGSTSAGAGFLFTPSIAQGTSGTTTALNITGATFGTTPRGINDNGTVVGSYETAGLVHGFQWNPSTPNATTGAFRNPDFGDLPSSAGGKANNFSIALDINNANQTVGVSISTALVTDDRAHAVLWQPGTTCPGSGATACTNLGDLSGGVITGGLIAVNEAGKAVGFGSTGANSNTDTINSQAALWTPNTPNGSTGTWTNLGRLAGQPITDQARANDINENDVVVGASGDNAFLWTAEDGMLDLNDLIAADDPLLATFFLNEAFAINDAGQIVGRGTVNGVFHAFLLVEATPVPVPAAAWLLGSGLLGMAGFRRRTQR